MVMKYAKVENEKTKVCSVGTGTDEGFYKSIGMKKMDVEQGYDGAYYLKGYAPTKPAPTVEELIAQKEAEIEELTSLQNARDIPALIRYQDEPEHEKYIEAKKFFDNREQKKDALKAEIQKLKQG